MQTPSKEYYSSFLALQGELVSIKKNRMGRFKYADLDALMEVIRPLLCKYGLILSHAITHEKDITFLQTVLVHAQTGQGVASMTPLKSFDAYDDQMAGKNITYLKRYVMMAMLNITVEDDVSDDNGDSGYSSAGSSTISEKQVKLLLARTKGDPDIIQAILSTVQVDALNKIPRNRFNSILESLGRNEA